MISSAIAISIVIMAIVGIGTTAAIVSSSRVIVMIPIVWVIVSITNNDIGILRMIRTSRAFRLLSHKPASYLNHGWDRL